MLGELVVRVRTARGDLEGLERSELGERIDPRATSTIGLTVRVERQRAAGDARNLGDERHGALSLALGGEGDEDMAGDARHARNGKGGQGRLQRIHEDALEPRAVLALEPYLVIVHQAYATCQLGLLGSMWPRAAS